MLAMTNIRLFCFCALLILVHTLYGLVFYFPGVYADQWDLVPKVGLFLAGEPWIKSMLAVHVDHLHTSSQIMMTLMAKWTNWHPAAELSLIMIINFASFILLFKHVLKPLLGFGNKQNILILIAIVSLYYSLAQAGNLLWTWQLSVHNCVFGVLLAITSLAHDKLSIKRFVLALLGGLFATFSFSCGVLIWPVGFILLVLHSKLSIQTKRLFASIWLMVTSGVVALFLNAFSGASEKIELSITNLGLFLLNAVGTPYAYFSHDLTVVVAVLGVVGAMYVFTRLFEIKKTALFDSSIIRIAVGFILFSLGSLLLIALGRLDFGLEQARSFRYIAFSQFFWIGFYILLSAFLTEKATDQTSKFKLHTTLLACALLLTVVNGLKIGRGEAKHAMQYREVLTAFRHAPEQERDEIVLQFNYLPPEPFLSERLAVLKENKLSFYSDANTGAFGQRVINIFSGRSPSTDN